MKTIYRYVLIEMMPAFLLGVTLLTSLFMINKVALLLDLLLNKNVNLGDTLLLFLSLLPMILSLTIPMSMMVATLLAFGRLSSDMEVTAFKTSGVHLFRLIGPVLLLSFLLTLFMIFFNDTVLPAANSTFKKVHYRILRDQAHIAIKERVFIDKFEGYQFYIDRQDREGLFSDVKMFFRWSPQASIQTALSKTGRLENDPSTMQLFFHMNNGTINWDNQNFHTYNRLYFERFTTRLNLENQLAGMTDQKKNFEEMTLKELSGEIKTAPEPSRRSSLKNEFHKRLSLPVACLALTWFCAPLGLWLRFKGFIGFVISLAMIFIYYLMFDLGQVLCERGLVQPLVGFWWANGILILGGTLVYYLLITEGAAFKGGNGLTSPGLPRKTAGQAS